MKEEIPLHPREPRKDVEQRRTTDRGTDPGTSEPGMPPRTDIEPERGEPDERSDGERSDRERSAQEQGGG
jgi:hypothetical protein